MAISKQIRICLGITLVTALQPAQASFRCGTNLVGEGATTQEVQEKCGSPDKKVVEGPAKLNNGVPKYNAVEVQFWTYGPSNGASTLLRFIEGKLVEIKTTR